MTDEQAQLIVENTDRIATVAEAFLADAREAKNIDIEKLMSEAMSALRATNPAFDMAFSAMEQQVLEAGDGNASEDR